MSRFVAIECNGELAIHIPDAIGTYATLCGLDGDDDDEIVQQKTIDLPPRAKINCNECKRIFDMAKQYTKRDFEI